jgi:methylmalonyl-CoA/ethylmalonyl-CoA epimerase
MNASADPAPVAESVTTDPTAPQVSAVPPVGAGIGLLRIDHVGVAVPDLDAAIAFYERTFGMRCVHVEENTEQGVREAMLAVGPDGGMIQLLAPASPESTIAKFLDRNGPGVQQVAYTVRDVTAAAAALRERGLRVLYDQARRGTANSRVNFVHPKDAGGVLVELVEPAAQAH